MQGIQFSNRLKTFKKQLPLHLMILPGVIIIIAFQYLPIAGFIGAFKESSISSGLFGGNWVGFKYFSEIFSDESFYLSLKNTIGLSLLKFIITFPLPIILALVLNEVSFLRLKKLTQTASYLPYFLSYVVIAAIWMTFLDPRGPVNNLLMAVGIFKTPYEFMAEPKAFWGIATLMDGWQSAGYNAIIYIAAIAGINSEIYEAAAVDGVSRLKKIWYITLPSIKYTITTMFIMNFGNLLNGGSNLSQSYLMGNPFNHETSYTLQYYIVDVGLNNMRFGFATAIGLLLSITSLFLLIFSNWFTGKINNESII